MGYIGYYKVSFEATYAIGKNIGWVVVGFEDGSSWYDYTNVAITYYNVWIQTAINTNYRNNSAVHTLPEMQALYSGRDNFYPMTAYDAFDPSSILINGKSIPRDSISYELIPAFIVEAANFNDMFNLNNPSYVYKPGLSGKNFFENNTNITIDQKTGLMRINPKSLSYNQKGPMCYVVREYRAIPNSTRTAYSRELISYTMRHVVLETYGTAEPVTNAGIVPHRSIVDSVLNSNTAATCQKNVKVVFKAVGSPHRSLKVRDLSNINTNLIQDYTMNYSVNTGNNVDTAYITLSFTKKTEAPSIPFLYDIFYVNASGMLVSNPMPIYVVPGNGTVNLSEDTVYFCSSAVRLDATVAQGAKWTPWLHVSSTNEDSTIVQVAPPANRWYYAKNNLTGTGCKLNDSIYVKVITCDTVYGVMCIDRNKNCFCDPWEYRIPNTAFKVQGVSNVYANIVSTDSFGAYRFVPPSLNSYIYENPGMLFNCGINNKKSRFYNIRFFGNTKVDISVLDSVVISNLNTQMIDTNYCYGDNVNYDLNFFKNFGLMRVIMDYGDGKRDTIKDYPIQANTIVQSFQRKYTTGGTYKAKIYFCDFFYQALDSYQFKTVSVSSCLTGRVYMDANKDCQFSGLDRGVSNHRLNLKDNTSNLTNMFFTMNNGSYRVYLKKNVNYTLSNALPIMCNSNSNSKNITAFSKDTNYIMDIPLTPDFVNYTLLVKKYGKIGNGQTLKLDLSYGGYYLIDTAIKKYEIHLPKRTIVTNVSSNATFTQNANKVQIIQNTGKVTSIHLTFDSLSGNDTLCFLTKLWRVTPEMDTSDNIQYFCMREGAIDVGINQKQVSIASQINHQDFINKNDELVYQINFINNRTSTANHLLISDVIDPKLDILSFKLMGQSHSGQISWRANNELVFFYQNINLPDSASQDSLSRGFVQFSFKPISSLALNDIIRNKADLVFDFIDTRPTNTTLSRYVVNTPPPPPPPVSINESVASAIRFYPNPCSNTLNIAESPLSDYYLMNVLGQVYVPKVIRKTNEVTALDVTTLPNGFYLLYRHRDTDSREYLGEIEILNH